MNFQAKLIISALGMATLPLAQAADFEDFGRVVRVQPRVEQIRTPRQECRTEYVQVPTQQQERGQGGSIVGGIAGALLGSQVGSGNGKVAAAAAGAIAGAMVGDRVENNGRNVAPGVQEQAVRQCRTVEAVESRTNGYDVTYEYRGQTYTTLMSRDPGNRVRLRVSVEPLDSLNEQYSQRY
ncbi:glycine zipper 2TM domain-containing protein [Massilia sp. ST3]|uniref:glycine zipper 2TM domain-containing protein n=1 Tax=Massilia sp. ST3 TaxID=2824903 RepID=UPI001B830AFE|nr:glycine zipper 2TM domain-containing protein [Massilia sp. ST3]MBQ5949687.1 glycine zipper 2TM domain-containing protein [Massilia sp. ST3]